MNERLPNTSNKADFDPEQQLLERGDRLAPEESDSGFRVIRLQGEEIHTQPVPAAEAFPLSYEYRGVTPDTAEQLKAADLYRRIETGEVELEAIDDISKAPLGQILIPKLVPVQKQAYDAAVAEGRCRRGLFDTEEEIRNNWGGSEALADLVDPQQRDSIPLEESLLWGVGKNKIRPYIDDLDGIDGPNGARSGGLEGLVLHEAYDLAEGTGNGRSVRLLNFSGNQLSDQQLREASNVLRTYADESGGAIYESLYTIAILPPDHPSMVREKELPDGTTKTLSLNGYQSDHLLALSGNLLLPTEERPSLTPEAQAFFDSKLLLGEPASGPDKPKNAVSGGRWEITLAHEFAHIVPKRYMQERHPLPGPAPTLMGRVDEREHVAEVAAAKYAGGEDAQSVPQDQREAYDAIWQEHHTPGPNDDLPYKWPLGPSYVTCRQLDLTEGPLPFRLKNPGEKAAVYVMYRLVDSAAA